MTSHQTHSDTHMHIINPAAGCHYFRRPTSYRPQATTNLYGLVPKVFTPRAQLRLEPTTSLSQVRRSTDSATTPPSFNVFDRYMTVRPKSERTLRGHGSITSHITDKDVLTQLLFHVEHIRKNSQPFPELLPFTEDDSTTATKSISIACPDI